MPRCGALRWARLGEFLFSPWAVAQLLHNQMAAVVTSAFVVAAVGAYWTLRGEHAQAARAPLWALTLAFPFPYIANTAGWMTAELGRQPWLVCGLMRTAEGGSPTVHGGSTLFTTLGFAALYLVLAMLAAAAASISPVMIRSATDPALSLTALNSAAGERSLRLGLYWWPAGFVLAVVYVAVLFRLHRGKARAAAEGEAY